MAKKRVEVMCTAFRDGFQSCYGARVNTADFIPAVEAAREAGITHFEAGGGARYQSLYFYCNEDAFDMMDAFRVAAGPDANLQTLARGVNVVGLDSQSSDIIDLHAKMFKKHGMTTIRNFDALNDVNNLIYSGQCITNAGLNHEVCVTLMALPPGCEGAHDTDFYIKTLRDILDADIPFASVCFKDASGTATPTIVHDTIKAARKLLGKDAHIRFHTHETAGISVLGYKAALDAGADGIDLSLAPVSGGTAQPDYAVMWHALRGTNYDLGVDIDKVMEAEAVFKECMKDYFMPPEALAVEPLIPWSPMPGGALTANTQMLRDNNIMEKYPEVIHAMGEVVRRGGFGTSVTPVSQFYFQQAFNNVMFGPWKRIAEPYGKMVLGYFGKTPVEPDPEIVKIASEQMNMEVNTQPILELNDADPNKGIDAAKKMLAEANLETTDENIFIASTCKEKGIAFLKGEGKIMVRKGAIEAAKAESAPKPAPAPAKPAASASGTYNVSVNGTTYSVQLNGGQAVVNGQTYNVQVGAAAAPAAPAPQPTAPAPQPVAPTPAPAPAAHVGGGGGGETLNAPMPGSVFKVLVSPGDAVNAGQELIVLEAMKMEMPLKAENAGTVAEVLVQPGDQVQPGQALVILN